MRIQPMIHYGPGQMMPLYEWCVNKARFDWIKMTLLSRALGNTTGSGAILFSLGYGDRMVTLYDRGDEETKVLATRLYDQLYNPEGIHQWIEENGTTI